MLTYSALVVISYVVQALFRELDDTWNVSLKEVIDEEFTVFAGEFLSDDVCSTIPYHTIPYHTIPYHTIPYHTDRS